MVELPISSLKHSHTIETRQPVQVNTCQRGRQLRTRRDTRQILRNYLLTDHAITLTSDTDTLGPLLDCDPRWRMKTAVIQRLLNEPWLTLNQAGQLYSKFTVFWDDSPAILILTDRAPRSTAV